MMALVCLHADVPLPAHVYGSLRFPYPFTVPIHHPYTDPTFFLGHHMILLRLSDMINDSLHCFIGKILHCLCKLFRQEVIILTITVHVCVCVWFAECPYGDRTGWCKSMKRLQCYRNDGVCCATCVPDMDNVGKDHNQCYSIMHVRHSNIHSYIRQGGEGWGVGVGVKIMGKSESNHGPSDGEGWWLNKLDNLWLEDDQI